MDSEVLDKVAKQFENNNVHDLLIGESGTEIINVYDRQDLPTDYVSLMKQGIYLYYLTNKDSKIIDIFEKELSNLLDGNEKEIYSACYLLFVQTMLEGKGKAPFKINRDLILKAEKVVRNNKEKLSQYKEFFGKDYSNGIYGDILRLYHIYRERYQ